MANELNTKVPLKFEKIECTEEEYLKATNRVLELSEKAIRGPWKADQYGLYIWGPDEFMVSDQTTMTDDALFSIRGWGDLTGMGGAYRDDHDGAIEVQKANGNLIAEYRVLAPDLARVVLQLHERVKELEQNKNGSQIKANPMPGYLRALYDPCALPSKAATAAELKKYVHKVMDYLNEHRHNKPVRLTLRDNHFFGTLLLMVTRDKYQLARITDDRRWVLVNLEEPNDEN